MTDIPEGLVEAVARGIVGSICRFDLTTIEAEWEDWKEEARAAILAQNAWQDDLNRRMVEFVEFRGENPRGR